MYLCKSLKTAVLCLLLYAVMPAEARQATLPPPANISVDFRRDVKPILQANCYSCHGPSQPQAGLRLDLKVPAMRGGESGIVIIPGKSADSKLIRRLAGSELGLQMPPTGPLSAEEIGVIRAWIDQGAAWPEAALEEVLPVEKAGPADPRGEPLFRAIRNGQLAGVRAILEKDKSLVDVKGIGGAMPLMYAALHAGVDCMRLLVDGGADVNARNAAGATALMWAASDPAKVRLLLDRGANVNVASQDGKTALLIAARNAGAVATVKLLVDAGAKVDAADLQGAGVLTQAALAGDLEILKLLIAKGANVNAKATSGFTALMAAVALRCAGCVELLLARGADVNATTKRGFTALGFGAPLGDTAIVRMLLQKGANINVADDHGYTPLMLAAYSDFVNAEIVSMLLEKGADPSARGKDGETALSLATKRGNTAVTRLISMISTFAAKAAAGQQAASPRAVTSPDADSNTVRSAVQKSIDLLQKSGPVFVKNGACSSCHHQSLPSMAFAVARQKQFRIDERITREQVHASAAFADARRERLLQAIDVGGGADTVGYTLVGMAAENYPADHITDAMVSYLKASQSTDGRWRPTIHRPPLEYSDITTTAISLRAMQLYAPGAQRPGSPARAGVARGGVERTDCQKRIERAAAWLLDATPHSTEERVFHLFGLSWANAGRPVIDKAARSLLAEQRADGGWSPLPAMESDAYATGQTLAALHQSGRLPVSDPAYRRGVRFLLHTQMQDGSWLVKTRSLPLQPYFESGFPHGPDQWISAAATSWAAMALAHAAPSASATIARR